MTTPASKVPPQSRSLIWFLGLVVLGGIAGLVFYAQRAPTPPPAPPEPAKVDISELIRIDGRLVLRGNTNQAFTGWMTEQYPDGTPKSRSELSNGVLNGTSEGFHTNGVLQIREHFAAGIGDGPVQKWHPDGSQLSEGTAQNGQLEGLFRRWHTNGVLAEEIMLQAGQPHGPSRAWFPSGSLKAEVELENGKVVRQTFWNDGEKPPAPSEGTPR